jgi:hypothetical protein
MTSYHTRNQLSYRPVKSHKNEVRFLEVSPASSVDEPVVCRLVTVQLTDDVECLGLSSLHGDPTQSESILINGQLLAIPLHLAEAIRHVRTVFLPAAEPASSTSPPARSTPTSPTSPMSPLSRTSSRGNNGVMDPSAFLPRPNSRASESGGGLQPPQCGPKAPSWLRHSLRHMRSVFGAGPKQEPQRLRLWHEALCINPDDAREEETRPRITRAVFRQAKAVVGWTGPRTIDDPNTSSDLAIDTITFVSDAMPRDFGSDEDRARHPENYSPHHVWFESFKHMWDEPGQALGGEGQQPPKPSLETLSAPWQATRALLARPFFTRPWLMEEISQARLPLFLAGDRVLSWRHVLRLTRLIVELQDQPSDIFPAHLRPFVHDFPLGVVHTLLSEFERARRAEIATRSHASQVSDDLATLASTGGAPSASANGSTTGSASGSVLYVKDAL